MMWSSLKEYTCTTKLVDYTSKCTKNAIQVFN